MRSCRGVRGEERGVTARRRAITALVGGQKRKRASRCTACRSLTGDLVRDRARRLPQIFRWGTLSGALCPGTLCLSLQIDQNSFEKAFAFMLGRTGWSCLTNLGSVILRRFWGPLVIAAVNCISNEHVGEEGTGPRLLAATGIMFGLARHGSPRPN
jgi:hypothetical protein